MVRRQKTSKSVEFRLYAPEAKKVSLAGSFNNWDPSKKVAKKSSDGNWKVRINLKPGRYEYKFFVDGVWVNDPNCPRLVPNSFGTQNSLIEVK